jgi:hypothetical protein
LCDQFLKRGLHIGDRQAGQGLAPQHRHKLAARGAKGGIAILAE